MRDYILKHAVLKGDFTLASGKKSDTYVDVRRVSMSSEGAFALGTMLFEHLNELEIDAIGGPAMGAIPIVASTLVAYHRYGREIGGFWVRGEKKDHGLQNLIEGNLKSNVALVEDVCTTGRSMLRAILAVEAAGCKVVATVSIVDRCQGAGELLRQYNYHTFCEVPL